MSKTEFLQSDPEYRELSKAVQQFAETGTQEEQDALAYYFEKALRKHEGLHFESNTVLEKGLQENLTYSRYEEIKETVTNFVNRLFEIVDTTINTTFAKAEAEAMQKLEDKIQELEEHGIDNLIDSKLAAKEPECEKILREGLGVNPEMHVSDLNRYMEQLKKRGRLHKWTI